MRRNVIELAKSLLEGKDLRYRLFKESRLQIDGSANEKYYIKIPGRFFGWNWLRDSGFFWQNRIRFETEAEARNWIAANPNRLPKPIEVKEI
jgi:hypothetical protein